MLYKIVKSFVKYELTCKIRGHHKPKSEDEKDFLNNTKFPKETYCEDCGFALELKLDKENPESYWVKEI